MITANEKIMETYGESITWQNEHILPRWVLDNMDITITDLSPRQATFSLAYNPNLFRQFPPPSTQAHLCGQAIMALADSLLIFPVIAEIGHGKEMATLDMNTQFLRPVLSGDVTITAKVIQSGRRTVRGVVDIYDNSGNHCASSMVCYMFVLQKQ